MIKKRSSLVSSQNERWLRPAITEHPDHRQATIQLFKANAAYVCVAHIISSFKKVKYKDKRKESTRIHEKSMMRKVSRLMKKEKKRVGKLDHAWKTKGLTKKKIVRRLRDNKIATKRDCATLCVTIFLSFWIFLRACPPTSNN